MPIKAKTIAVTSGKGGVGKTNISVNLAVALASRSLRVCLFDADTNQANANILLGLVPKLTLEHVLDGRHTIEDVLIDAAGGVSVVPAASGVAHCDNLDAVQRRHLAKALTTLESSFDYIIIDTAAGTSRDVIFFLKAAALILLTITPEPTSLTNAFSLLRVMYRQGVDTPSQVIVNQVRNTREFHSVFNRFQGAVAKYLNHQVEAFGYILADDTVRAAVQIQRPVIFLRYDAPASLCFYQLARRLEHTAPNQSSSDQAREGLSNAVAATEKASEDSSGSHADARAVADLTHLEPQRVSQLLAYALQALQQARHPNQSETAESLNALLAEYLRRFKALPFTLDRTLYQFLEASDYPSETIRSIVLTLERFHERRDGHSLHDVESLIAILMMELRGDQSRMKELWQRVADSFAIQFGRIAPLSASHISAAISENQFDRQTLQELRAAIDNALPAEHGHDTQPETAHLEPVNTNGMTAHS